MATSDAAPRPGSGSGLMTMPVARITMASTTTMSYLEKIVAQTRIDVAEAKTKVPEAELRKLIAARPPPTPLSEAIQRGAPLAVLAEFKKASPR